MAISSPRASARAFRQVPIDPTNPELRLIGQAIRQLQELQVGGVFNVKDYGGKGDGVTDDRAAIQATWDAADTAGGGIVDISPGTWIIDDRSSGEGFLQFYGSNIWVRGAGREATILKRADNSEAASDDHLLMIGEGASNPASNIKISDLTIDGNRANNTGGPEATHNIRIENATDILIDNVESKNAIYYGLHIRGEDATTKRIVVRAFYVHTCGRDCIDLKNQGGYSDDIILSNIIAEAPGLQGVSNDACFDFRGPLVAADLIAKLTGTRHHGIRVRGLDNSTVEGRPTVINFRIVGNASHGTDAALLIEGIEVKLTNGYIDDCGAVGAEIQGARAQLTNVQVRACDGDGFWLRSGSRGRLVNCLSSNNGGAGFDIDTDNNTLVACEARNNTGNGVEIVSGADRNDFIGTESSGNSGSDWSDAGAGNIWHAFREGTAAYTTTSGGNTTVTFDSAFPTACLGVNANIEGDPIATAESVFVDTIGASSFVARHRPNPGAVSRTIRYWAWGR